MIAASLVAWLWMAAQTHAQFDTNVKCWYFPDSLSLDCAKATPQAAEHVIEIKTSKKLNGKAMSCDLMTYTGGANCREIKYDGHCPMGTSCTEEYDYRREIYVDGQRWGVLKESQP